LGAYTALHRPYEAVFLFPVSIELKQGQNIKKYCCLGLLSAPLAVFLEKVLPTEPISMRMGLGDSI